MKYTQLKKIILFISLVSFVFIGCTQQGAKEPKKKGEVKNLVSDVENVSIIGIGEYKIHTFYGVSNSHVIETPEKLIMIDAQFDFNLAKELKKYVATLNKPLERIILSHAHPDHFKAIPILFSKFYFTFCGNHLIRNNLSHSWFQNFYVFLPSVL